MSTDIIGQTFGELFVGRLVGRNERRENVYLCRCSCDGAALRTAGALRGSVRRGYAPCCARCHREVWAGARIERRAEHVEAWAALWERHGTLWSEQALSRIGRDVREKVAAELGGFDERPALPVETVEAEESSGADHESGNGGDAMPTLEEIGATRGVSRERARGEILTALRHFAEAWDKMFPRDDLRALVTGDERDRKVRGVVRLVELDAAIAAAARTPRAA